MSGPRIKVRGRNVWLVLGIAAASGVGAATAGCSPTGETALDVVLVFGGVAAVVWSAASAPWWAGVVVAALATAFARDSWSLGLGAVATCAGLAIGLGRRALPWSRALVAGLALQVLARLGAVGFFGLTSSIAIVASVALTVLGVTRRPRGERRVMWMVGASVGGFLVLASAGFGIGALHARADLESANRSAQEGLDLIGEGRFAEAQVSLDRARFYFDRADTALGRPWTQLARVVPVVAQHRAAAGDLVDEASQLTDAAARALSEIDVDSLRLSGGRIDLGEISRLEAPLEELNAAVDALSNAITDNESPWLVQPLRDRLGELQADVERQQERGDDALAAVRQAPAMLGAEGPRVYFVAFTTPAEARGLGGFMGNWAEVTIDHGVISFTGFGRTTDLNRGGDVGTKTLSGPDDLLANYGEFLLDDPETRIVGPEAWSNITASPDFPAVAQVIAELYPQSGGRQIDGVFAIDIETIARLMQITGPVAVPEIGRELDAQSVIPYLMREQYLLPVDEARVDALETVARETVTRLLTATLPAPPDLADLLSPMAQQGRLVGWAARHEEEDVLQRINMSGALPELESDGLAITFNNANGSKIDDLLDAQADYSVEPDETTGEATATLTLTLTNNAPASGLPDVIIGNLVDLPKGTNSTYLSVYTPLDFTNATVDGESYPFSVNEDNGYLVLSAFVDIPPKSTMVVELSLVGGLDLSDGYSLVLRTPPTARPFRTTVTVDGTRLAETDGTPGVSRYRPAL
ncbi:MAG: DUF4012 domain-containing protein [Acidimicrobiia bacterium]